MGWQQWFKQRNYEWRSSPDILIQWTSSEGGNSSTASNLNAGNFTVTVTDANGCTATAQATQITQPPAITGNAAPTPASCNGKADGVVSITLGRGTGPYSYNWHHPSTNASATGLAKPDLILSRLRMQMVVHVHPAQRLQNLQQITYTSTNTIAEQKRWNRFCDTERRNWSVYIFLGTFRRNASNANNLSASAYSVTITDSHGCTTLAAVVVPNVAGPTATVLLPLMLHALVEQMEVLRLVLMEGTAPFIMRGRKWRSRHNCERTCCRQLRCNSHAMR